MAETSGILWAMQVVIGPLVLGIALVYAALHYRRNRKLQGEGASGPHTGRDMLIYGLPVAIAVVLFALVMLIPGSG